MLVPVSFAEVMLSHNRVAAEHLRAVEQLLGELMVGKASTKLRDEADRTFAAAIASLGKTWPAGSGAMPWFVYNCRVSFEALRTWPGIRPTFNADAQPDVDINLVHNMHGLVAGNLGVLEGSIRQLERYIADPTSVRPHRALVPGPEVV